jgi:surface polysaccharide O-acyltransferase-like enzyme
MLHAAIEPHPVVTEITQAEVWRWWTVNIYDSLARPCVPLFVMASGFLLLSPEKTDEPLSLFFKKRLSRIALPFIFWGITYFAWRFLVNDEAFAYGSIIQGFNTGPYYHFWFLYMLLGLYMITPIFRVLVAHSQRKILKYFLAIWFLGTAVIPLLNLQTSFSVDSNLFVFVGWIGYFLLGAFLKSVKIKTLFFCTLLSVGWILTMIATYFITASVGGLSSYFFYDYLSANVIMASVGLFMLLYRIPRRQLENISSRLKWLIHKIGQNTLSIFMLHVIILESFQKGFFGFKISVTTINPAIEIPLITGVTLFVCLGIIWSAKKIPFVEKIIG